MSAIDLLNAPSAGVLESAFAGATPVIEAVAQQRPFASIEHVVDVAAAILRAMPRREQIAILNRHPRLGESPERLRNEHGLSYVEQRGGLDRDDPVAVELGAANARYEEHFGFRFVTFVNGRPLREIGAEIDARMQRSLDEELAHALHAFVAIARHRLTVLGRDEEVSAG